MTLKFIDTSFTPRFKTPLSIFLTIRSILTWHAIRTHALEQIGWNQTRRERTAVLHGFPIPWFTYASVQFIDQTVSNSASILEIGGGNSSLYWINRGNYLVTLETNEFWVNLTTSYDKFNNNIHEVITIPIEN